MITNQMHHDWTIHVKLYVTVPKLCLKPFQPPIVNVQPTNCDKFLVCKSIYDVKCNACHFIAPF